MPLEKRINGNKLNQHMCSNVSHSKYNYLFEKMHGHLPAKYIPSFMRCSLKSKIYNSIGPILTDVSLRDGLQHMSYDAKHKMLSFKTELYDHIAARYAPSKMEVGAIVSHNQVPIMADSASVYQYAKNSTHNKPENLFLLVPNAKFLDKALYDERTRSADFAFLTSVSDKYQKANVKMSVAETKQDLHLALDIAPFFVAKKLYISCVNECPLQGYIHPEYIAEQIMEYYADYNFTELCLSDTMGSLKYKDFEIIVGILRKCNIPMSALSLHLHTGINSHDIKWILFHAFDVGIRRFDVSLLDTGGSIIENGRPNLSYTQFYEIMSRYLHRIVS